MCHGCRFGGGDDVDDPAGEPVDALTMGSMMALVAQQGGDLDVALEQVRLLGSGMGWNFWYGRGNGIQTALESTVCSCLIA